MDVIGTLLTAAGAFAATNLDALVVLAILFLSHRAAEVPKTWKIWAGQYLGLGAIVAVSILAALGLAAVPLQWVGLLGLVPVTLGVRGLVRIAQADTGRAPAAAASLASVAAMTLANGGDNVAVYVPLFRGMDEQSGLLTVVAFAALVAVWCTAASWLTTHPKVIDALGRWGHWAVPVLYMAVGAAIMARSGVFSLLMPG
ncbi:cadmium resistance transporter [Arthrobacter sp. SDTb3-6]|uniref:cadmium resistance transporter n=1 Tax=Arthrobacter sp. SDTb3-6 TaxID=2713571 RepID=UPI00159E899D|nr:cadmium resistance transporter [Arthrobacter sp. SDTb3-6]NVN00408.1 cadmium transporter [Arthrobacter sp. SDTb3-6]